MSMHFAGYASSRALPRHVHRAASLLSRCRSGELGSHIEACPEGHFERIVLHACRHRLCPQCNALPREQWLARMRERVIDCAHHHLIFTLPHELHGLWRGNRAWMTQHLFACVAQTLRELTRDERYLGAEAGFMLALHTWGRSLSLHPHIHCLISDGGLTGDGEWRAPRRSAFLPVRVVMALFRGKFLSGVRRTLEQDDLRIEPGESFERTYRVLNRLGRVKWNVHLCERYAHAHGVVTYLARYLKGGALNNRQLIIADEQRIAFRYYAHGQAPGRSASLMHLPPQDFLSRYLQHTPLPGVPMVRHYGLYASGRVAQLNQARALHEQDPLAQASEVLRCVQYLQQHPQAHAFILNCPQCQAPLLRGARWPLQQAPPVSG